MKVLKVLFEKDKNGESYMDLAMAILPLLCLFGFLMFL